ncbi:MAG: DUF4956 domain-containing protein [Butyrivibrio sp.]|nr:DUF4956 domain-containing protein [Butyrivibrio sp.]
MDVLSMIKRAVIEGYATDKIGLGTIIICFVFTLAISLYICGVYKLITRKAFYNKSFNLSLLIIALITSAIILTIQSNIVVSLGMVGALSIVRFRTAIKDPMDLAFLFWAISAGIICGAGFALIAVVVSLIVTVVIMLFENKHDPKGSMLLVVDSNAFDSEKEILAVAEKYSSFIKVRARNASKVGLDLTVEVKTEKAAELIQELLGLEHVTNASLIEHDGNITA